MDNIDLKIMKLIQKDASLSLDTLSKEVGLSRNACWRRVNILEKSGVIKGRVALLSPEKLGFGLTMIVLIKTNRHAKSWLETFNKVTKRMPEIVSVYRLGGDLDYMMKIIVKDANAYDETYQRLIKEIEIYDISASFVMETLKDTTELPI